MNAVDITQLSLREEFQVLEAIWSDLEVPLGKSADLSAAHREILDARRQRVDSGAAKLVDWNQVKNAIGAK